MTTPAQIHAQQVSEQMKQQKIEETRKAITECHELAIVRHENHRIPEQVFREGFLPFFTGQDNDPKKPHMANWIAIAGSPTSEVDVVDEADQVLFTVPAMMSTGSISLKTVRGESMGDLMRQYQHHKSITPHAGNNFAHTHFGEKAKDLVSDPTDNFTKAQEGWSKIFNHYNIPDPNAKPEAAAVAQTAVSSAAGDYDYD